MKISRKENAKDRTSKLPVLTQQMKENTMSTSKNTASKSSIVTPTEAQAQTGQSMIQKVILSGILWRSNDRMALWAVADNNFMFIFKQELEKNDAYTLAAQIQTKKQITAANWNRVGFMSRKIEVTDEKQELLAI